MGTYLNLEILPDQIDPDRWAAVYHEVRTLLCAHQPPLCGLALRELEGVGVPVYTPDLERHVDDPSRRELCVVGDLGGLETAEDQQLYYDLSRYRSFGGSGLEPVPDVLLCAERLRFDWSGSTLPRARVAMVFGNKTQALPYHIPLLAVAMLIEARFPTLAIAGGTIDRGEARRAQAWAEAVSGETLPLPVCLDPQRLGQRLVGTLPLAELDQALDVLLLDDRAPRRLEAQLTVRPPGEREGWLTPLLVEDNRPSWAGLRAVVVAWLNVTGELQRLCELAHGSVRDEDLVDALASAWIAVSHAQAAALRAEVGVGDPCRGLGEVLMLAREEASFDLDLRVDADHLRGAFESAFGPRAAELHARLLEQTEREMSAFGEPRAMLRQLAHLAGAKPNDGLERLFLVTSRDDLSDMQREHLVAFADAIRPLRPEGRATASAAQLRQAIAERLRSAGRALSEAASIRIQREHDTEILCVYLTALAIRMPDMTQWQMQRAVLENRALARFVADLG